MNVVDPSGWLSYFADDKNAVVFAKPIEKTEELVVPSITLTEVFKRILQQREEEHALQATAHMQQGRVIALDSGIALEAAYIGFKKNLSLEGSIVYATAKRYKAKLWTQDSDFEGLENVNYIPKR